MFFLTNPIRRSSIFALVALLSACGGSGVDNPVSANAQEPVVQGGATESGAGTTTGIPPLSQPPFTLTGQTFGTSYWSEGDTASGGHGPSIAGVDCYMGMSETYHIHSHLTIFKDGKMLTVPAGIGFGDNGCSYELHTHDASGKIHVETAAYKPFTLGQFFAVWGQPLTTANVAGLTGEPIVVYINDGTTVRVYDGNPADIALQSGRNITIQVGTPPKEIPSFTPYQ